MKGFTQSFFNYVFSPYFQVIVASHTELRCPECRILVDIKIDDLPPNVLLMRILGGMKNTAMVETTITPLQMHRQQTTASAVGNLKISNLNLNGISSEHGAGGVNAYIRDQVKRAANAAAKNAETGGHRGTGSTAAAAATAVVVATEASTAHTNNAIITTAKPTSTTDDASSTQNAQRSTQQPSTHQAARQPLQALPSTVNSNNSQQQQQQLQQQSNNTTSPASIPHAKALYDFESKEPG